MERDSLHGLDRPPLSLYNPYSRNPIMKPFLSRTYWSFSPSNIPSKGLLKAPPLSLLHSAPFLLPPPPQPPLLPLPASLPRLSSSFPGPSCSPAIKNGARKTRDHAFTPKKSTKPSSTKNSIPKKEEKKAHKRSSDILTVSSTSRFGESKNLASVSRFDSMTSKDNSVIESSSSLKDGFVVFTMSPPPSSLPLPTFSLRPKLSCSGIDAGATDDLRRLLRLQ